MFRARKDVRFCFRFPLYCSVCVCGGGDLELATSLHGELHIIRITPTSEAASRRRCGAFRYAYDVKASSELVTLYCRRKLLLLRLHDFVLSVSTLRAETSAMNEHWLKALLRVQFTCSIDRFLQAYAFGLDLVNL